MTATVERPALEVGSARLRKEDAHLITGRTTWTDNLTLPGMLHLAILRSPMAHARITRIDVSGGARPPRCGRRVQRARLRRDAGLDPVRVAGHGRHGEPGASVARGRSGQPCGRGGGRDRGAHQGRGRGRARGDRCRLRGAAARPQHGGGDRRRREPGAPEHDVESLVHLGVRFRRGRDGRCDPRRARRGRGDAEAALYSAAAHPGVHGTAFDRRAAGERGNHDVVGDADPAHPAHHARPHAGHS